MQKERPIRNLFIVFVVTVYTQTVFSQIPMSSKNDGIRYGVALNRIEVDYISDDNGGMTTVWKFGKVDDKERRKDSFCGLVFNMDTVAVIEKDCIRHYFMHGDTISEKGEQSRRSYVFYEKERPIMHRTFQYGDSLSRKYEGRGVYENIDMLVSGFGYTVVDGTGILTDGVDSVPCITRIRMFDDYVETYSNNSEIHMRDYRYIWCHKGYSYPIMESVIKKQVTENYSEVMLDSVTYLYYPVAQHSWSMSGHDESESDMDVGTDGDDKSVGNMSLLHAAMPADGMRVDIEYFLSDCCEISFIACDIAGNILGSVHHDNNGAGDYHECITLNRRPFGKIVILHIQCGSEAKAIKVNNKE